MKERDIRIEEALKKYLKKEKCSQAYLAQKLGIRRSTLNNYLYGVRPQGLKTIIKISYCLDLTLDELIFGP